MFIASVLAFLDASTWQNMFYLDADQVTWAEKVIRPVIVYAALIVLLRVVANESWPN